MDSKTVNISHPEHQKNVLSLFYNLYKHDKLVDVTISCLEGSLKAHKIILSTCSPFFQKIFEDNPCKHPVLILRGTTLNELQTILDFIYTGSLLISENKLESISKIADDLNIKSLKECLSPKTSDKEDKKNLKRSAEPSSDGKPKQMKLEDLIKEEKNIPFHGRDTRFKGKKRVEVHHDRILFARTSQLTSQTKSTSQPKKTVKISVQPQISDNTKTKGSDNKNNKNNSDSKENQDGKNIPEKTSEKKDEQPKEEKDDAKETYPEQHFLIELNDFAVPDVELHEGEEEFDCPEEFVQDYRMHLENDLLMVEEFNFKCDICFKTFRTDNDLHCHKRVHTEKKPFKCDFCDTSFTRSSHLARHRRTHTGERPFYCKICGRSFARQDKLKTHSKTHFEDYVPPPSVKKKIEMEQEQKQILEKQKEESENREKEENQSDDEGEYEMGMLKPGDDLTITLIQSADGKRGRGRPRKYPMKDPFAEKRPRGRPRKLSIHEKSDDPAEDYDLTTLPFGDFSYLIAPMQRKSEDNAEIKPEEKKEEQNSNSTSKETENLATIEPLATIEQNASNDTSESSENNEPNITHETIEVEVHATNDGTEQVTRFEKQVNGTCENHLIEENNEEIDKIDEIKTLETN